MSKDVKLQLPILKNDERIIAFKWPNTNEADIAVIDKGLGSFKLYHEGRIAGSGVEGMISAEGSCQQFER
jgi:hypothetical protein